MKQLQQLQLQQNALHCHLVFEGGILVAHKNIWVPPNEIWMFSIKKNRVSVILEGNMYIANLLLTKL